jgi:hypothetical protein
MARGIQVGDKAPDFTLPSQSGDEVRLADRLGERVVVLYFYPKDNTSGCTAEACAFRDSYETQPTSTPPSPDVTTCRSRCSATAAAGSAKATGSRPCSAWSLAASPTSSTAPARSGMSSAR